MPLPMVHLGTAREYAKNKSGMLKCPEFYLGALSPDAIHMRNETGREDKNITHLFGQGHLWKENVIEFIKKYKNKSNYSFYLGYGIHILTDIIWHETVYAKFKLAYDSDTSPIQERGWAYYNDTDKLDLEMYRMCEWRQEVWNLLIKSKCFDADDILTANEISAWNNRTLGWYEGGKSQHNNPIKYISLDEILEFTVIAGERIRQILESEEI